MGAEGRGHDRLRFGRQGWPVQRPAAKCYEIVVVTVANQGDHLNVNGISRLTLA
jgi:hypothetical protein